MGQFEQILLRNHVDIAAFDLKWAAFGSDFHLLFNNLLKLRLDPKSQNLAFPRPFLHFLKDLPPSFLYSACFGKLSLAFISFKV